MKYKFRFNVVFGLLVFILFSCNEDSVEEPKPSEPALSYILNYGSYSGDKSTITQFQKESGTAVNQYYETVNGYSITSNIQHGLTHNGNIYFLGNNPDQLFWVDGVTFEQTQNGISTDIVKPRYAVGTGDYLYVSCWGGDIWADITVSYIAKVNVQTGEVEKKIPMHYGPEGLALVGNKLYAALNYTNKIAVMNLGTEAISYIDLPAGNIPSFFETDDKNNLYVNLGVAYGDEVTQTGIGYINTTSDQIEAKYDLDGVSSMIYVDVLEFNADYSKLYVMTTGGWGQPGGVAVFDVASESFESEKVVDGVMGINGIGYYDQKIFCFFSENVTSNGKAVTYSADGTKLEEFETGIAPYMMLTAD